jgi:hypothetical protein
MALFLNEIEVSQPKLPFGLGSIPVLLMRRRGPAEAGPPFSRWGLEMESDLRRDGPGRHVMGSAESGEKVVKRILVGDIDGGELQTHSVPIAAEVVKVVISDSEIEKMPCRDARRILVVVLRSGSRNLDQRRSVL